jgi:hypothetical protein
VIKVAKDRQHGILTTEILFARKATEAKYGSAFNGK